MALRDGRWPIHRLPQQTPWAHPWPMLREQRGRHPPSECPLSNHGDGGGGVGDGNDEAENDSPPRRRPRAAASEGCILGKINELGEDGGASDFKKNMADFCGVSFKGAFEGWAQEVKEKFGLVVRGNGSGS